MARVRDGLQIGGVITSIEVAVTPAPFGLAHDVIDFGCWRQPQFAALALSALAQVEIAFEHELAHAIPSGTISARLA